MSGPNSPARGFILILLSRFVTLRCVLCLQLQSSADLQVMEWCIRAAGFTISLQKESCQLSFMLCCIQLSLVASEAGHRALFRAADVEMGNFLATNRRQIRIYQRCRSLLLQVRAVVIVMQDV